MTFPAIQERINSPYEGQELRKLWDRIAEIRGISRMLSGISKLPETCKIYFQEFQIPGKKNLIGLAKVRGSPSDKSVPTTKSGS